MFEEKAPYGRQERLFINFLVDCDWQCYLDRHRDLQKAFGPQNLKAAKEHWKDYGRKKLCLQRKKSFSDANRKVRSFKPYSISAISFLP